MGELAEEGFPCGTVGVSECHLLDVLQRDAVLAQLLVDKDQGEEVAHPAIEQLVWEPASALNHPLVVLQQPGGWGWGSHDHTGSEVNQKKTTKKLVVTIMGFPQTENKASPQWPLQTLQPKTR